MCKVKTWIKGFLGRLTKSQKAALMAIQELEKAIEDTFNQTHWRMGDGEIHHYPMEEVEKQTESSLKKIEELIKEYNLDNKLYLNCEKKAYLAGLKRKEYEWAAAFAKKHGL